MPKEMVDDPTQYRGRVTLTERFLYLVKKAYEGGEAINTMNALDWVGPDRAESMKKTTIMSQWAKGVMKASVK